MKTEGEALAEEKKLLDEAIEFEKGQAEAAKGLSREVALYHARLVGWLTEVAAHRANANLVKAIRTQILRPCKDDVTEFNDLTAEQLDQILENTCIEIARTAKKIPLNQLLFRVTRKRPLFHEDEMVDEKPVRRFRQVGPQVLSVEVLDYTNANQLLDEAFEPRKGT